MGQMNILSAVKLMSLEGAQKKMISYIDISFTAWHKNTVKTKVFSKIY